MTSDCSSPGSGSSPHTRGARRRPSRRLVRRGIIPAYAGSTRYRVSPSSRMKDHPRIRGEHPRSCSTVAVSLGSSPHTRGAPTCVGGVSQAVGIIPAYAGSTSLDICRKKPTSDHPRIRGEHKLERVARNCQNGSSPHTRGAPPEPPSRPRRRRIIPAYAGSTASPPCRRSAAMDHPRIRGEHFIKYGIIPSSEGSSPHTRGARRSRARTSWAAGIIPAYAGSTFPSLASTSARRDHPRIRGEHGVPASPGILERGSSPHTRGAPSGASLEGRPVRIIPAYAGSTFSWRRRRPGPGDHPRIRGEHVLRDNIFEGQGGSSPHTRGAHIQQPQGAGAERIIPAYAGSTADRRKSRRAMCGSSPHTRGAPAARASHRAPTRIIPAYAGSTIRCRVGRRPASDHPRIRGEHAATWTAASISPRIIPAYAGSTRTAVGSICRAGDHPRIRGEHATKLQQALHVAGSSPHTRGAQARYSLAAGDARIIPAYAGSTEALRIDPRDPPDHPRIRGEHSSPSPTKSTPKGSSPHTRGARRICTM